MNDKQPVASVLPQEIWVAILRHLDHSDLFRLRLCCKRFNQIVSTATVWKSRCWKRWLEHMSHDPFDEEFPSGSDWFYYYRFRNRIDQSLLQLLRKLVNENDSTEYWHLYRLMLRYNPSHTIPFLHGVVRRGFLSSEPFDVVTLCQHLLTSVRHKHVYDLFRVGERASFVHNAEETFFLPLAAMDPSFDRLLHFRSDAHDRVHSLIKAEFNNLQDFLNLPTTLKVDKLISRLFEALDLLDKDRQLFIEDFILLRIYAGETAGHPLLILSMVQYLASTYGVETVLCGSYLIIHDPHVRDGETYLTIASSGIPKIFTKRRLVLSLKRILGSSDYIIQREILPTILQPLRQQELLATVFKELLPLYNKSKWSVAAPKTMEELQRLFPHSNQPIRPEMINYFLCVFKSMEIRSKTERSISVMLTVTFKEVFQLISRLFPGDLSYAEDLLKCRGAAFSEMDLEYGDWLSQIHNISLRANAEFGNFVVSLRDQQILCVIGVKELNSAGTFYNLMSFAGEFYVEHSSNIRTLDAGEEENVIKRFLTVGFQSDLGLVFKGIDWLSHKLIPNSHVSHIIKTL
ncbi:hypothetical protein HG536_0E01350 [Torulaspora globosa]|uniref:F-box domain-containing protein n=1 Tax=Torulaspora globosa TaxID=48254 RepID=A0A7G3ZI88_9SACH|nr:uncharacterized protein HG536_0E01350 [Torulaspora globosa]QLL33224.1 hypothetical protein HG536_0E01350 [Torulaspora globosa]